MVKAKQIINVGDYEEAQRIAKQLDIVKDVLDLSSAVAQMRKPIETLIDTSQYKVPHKQTVNVYDDNVIMYDQSGLLMIRVRVWLDGRVEATIKSGALHKYRGNVPVLFNETFHIGDELHGYHVYSVIKNEIQTRKNELFKMVNVNATSQMIFESRTEIINALAKSVDVNDRVAGNKVIDKMRAGLSKAYPSTCRRYQKLARQLLKDAQTVSNNDLSSKVRIDAVNSLHVELDKCAHDPEIKDLTMIYRDTKPQAQSRVNFGYDEKATTRFIIRFAQTFGVMERKNLYSVDLVPVGSYGYAIDEYAYASVADVDNAINTVIEGINDPVERTSINERVVDGSSLLNCLDELRKKFAANSDYHPTIEFKEPAASSVDN